MYDVLRFAVFQICVYLLPTISTFCRLLTPRHTSFLSLAFRTGFRHNKPLSSTVIESTFLCTNPNTANRYRLPVHTMANVAERRRAILVEGDVYIGGKTFFDPAEITVDLIWGHGYQTHPYVGFQLHLPKLPEPSISLVRGSWSDVHIVKVKFNGPTTVIDMKLVNEPGLERFKRFVRSDKKDSDWMVVRIQGTPTIQYWPMPFHGEQPYDGWMRDEPVKGFVSIQQTLYQKRNLLPPH
jgi:hypothetical protein